MPGITHSESAADTPRRADRDRHWLASVYQGSAPQFTPRAIVAGFALGGLLSVSNLYVGAKVGITLDVSVTAIVLAYLAFQPLRTTRLGRGYHILEANIVQTMAGSAGYIVSPLCGVLAAQMVITNATIPLVWLWAWLMVLGLLGVTLAIPFKRMLINDQEQPTFPEGRACACLLESLHGVGPRDAIDATPLRGRSDARGDQGNVHTGRVLLISALLAGLARILQSTWLLSRLRLGFLGIPEFWDDWYYRLAGRLGWWIPSLAGVPLRELTVRPTCELAMIGLGGLMGIGTCASLLLGAIVNYLLLVPWMIRRGDIVPVAGDDGALHVGFRDIAAWSLWCGVAMITAAALTGLVKQMGPMIRARHAGGAMGESVRDDPLRGIEVPPWLGVAGFPMVVLALIWLSHRWFGVVIWASVAALPLAWLTALIGISSTALTSITPTGALGRINQLAFGLWVPHSLATNVVASGIHAEGALQSATLLQQLTPGYLLGARPRLQIWAHLLGTLAGALTGATLFHHLYLQGNPAGLISQQHPFPAVVVWMAFGQLMTSGARALPASVQVAGAVGFAMGIGLELVRARARNGWWPQPLAVGLAFLIPFDMSFAMFGGAFVFWVGARLWPRQGQVLHWLLVRQRPSIGAGMITGTALVAVVVTWLDALSR